MNSAEVREAQHNLRATAATMRAYNDFFDAIAGIAIALAERKDPVALLLLDAMKNFQARTGEFVVSEGETE